MLAELVEDAKNAGLTIKTLKADVINPADRLAMLGAMSERFGGMDVLINNAGIGATGHFAEAAEDRLRSIFEVNFFGLAELTRQAVPILRQGVNPAVVNISSVLGSGALPGRSEYSSSKFAVQGLSEALRGELSKDGIDVIVVNPGFTATNFSQNMLERNSKFQADHMRGMTSEQVAVATLRAMARGTNDLTLTAQGKLFLFMNRFFPRLVDWIINRRVKRLYAVK